MSIVYSDNAILINATGGPQTSGAYDISKRQQITLQFISTGTATFTVDESNDGTNWITGVSYLDAKATTGGGTFVTSSVVSTPTQQGAIITPGFRYIRVNVTPAGGNATCILQNGG